MTTADDNAGAEPMYERLRVAVLDMYEAMPAQLVEETQALIALDPDGSMRGVRLVPAEDDYVHVVWGGRHLGTIDWRWLRTGLLRDVRPDA